MVVPPVLNGPTTVTSYTQTTYARNLDVRYWTGCTPRPTILIVHAGGWKGDTPDRTINGAVGAAVILASMGFNTVNIDYWGYDHAPGYNNTRPLTDVQNAILWCRNATNATLYNLNPLSVNLLGHSAGGQLGWRQTMVGTTGTTRPDTMCSWSGPNHHQECEGTGAQGDARHYTSVANTPYVGNEAAWHAIEPGETILVNPGIPGRCVGSAAEDTVGTGVAYSQQTQLITAAAALGSPYIITEKKISIANGYAVENLHYNFCGNATYGGDTRINDIVDTVVPGSGYVAWLASHGVTPT